MSDAAYDSKDDDVTIRKMRSFQAVVVSYNGNNGNAGEPSGNWCLGLRISTAFIPSTGYFFGDLGLSPSEKF